MNWTEDKILSIVKDCIKGRRRAQGQLFKLYAPKVMSMCRRYTSNNETAKDVMQECFLQIFDSLESYKPDAGLFEGWLHRVAQRTIWRMIKRDWDWSMMAEEEADEKSLMVDANSFQLLANEEIIDEIQTLPAGYKMVLNLYVFEQRSHKEIAALLGIGENTSRSQLARARKLLRSKLEAKNKFNYVKNTI